MRYLLIVLVLMSAGTAAARDRFADPRPDDVPALIDALDDPDLQYGAALALRRVGQPAVALLIKSVQKRDDDRRIWAAYALGRIGPAAKDAVPVLIEMLNSDDPALRAIATEALGRIGPDASAAAPALAKLLRDKDERTRTWAAIALGRIGPGAKAAAPALIDSLRDGEIAAHCAESLKEIGEPAALLLVEALSNDELRLAAARVLREIDPQAAAEAGVDKPTVADVPALILVLQDRQRSIEARNAAARTLGDLRETQRSMPALIEALDDENVGDAAIESLGRIGAPAVEPLIAKLNKESASVRLAAAASLGRIGPDASAAIEPLIATLKDRQREVRREAAAALGSIGPDAKRAVPALIALIKSNDAEEVRQAAIKSLFAAAPVARQTVIDAFVETYKTETGNFGVRQLAGMMLQKLDPEAAHAAGFR